MARILIIDDDPMIRDILRVTLEREGHEVIEAQHGLEALQHFQTAPADLVITDILMPEKDGLETIRDLRQISPTVKIIAMSGGGRTKRLNLLDAAMHLGAQRTLLKPFTIEEILELVRELLNPSP